MKLILAAVIVLAIISALWLINAYRNPAVRYASFSYVWFAAIKNGDNINNAYTLAEHAELSWQVGGDLGFISSDGLEPYWGSMVLLGSNTSDATPIEFSPDITDAYLVRLEPYNAPPLALAFIALLPKLGIWSKPKQQASKNVDLSLIRSGIGPSQESVNALFQRPLAQQPLMVNFLKFYEQAQYDDGDAETDTGVTGRAAYDRYGEVANKAVYTVGGSYVLGGYIREVIRTATSGPTAGDWDDIAVMRYPNQTAILTMEHIEEYRDALFHRNAGLEKTVIIATKE